MIHVAGRRASLIQERSFKPDQLIISSICCVIYAERNGESNASSGDSRARNRIAKPEKSRLASKVLALLVANQSPPTYTTPALSRIAITRGSSLQEDSAADMIVSIVYGLSSVAPTRRSYARPAPPLDLAPYSRRSIHGSGGLYKTQPWNIFEIRDV